MLTSAVIGSPCSQSAAKEVKNNHPKGVVLLVRKKNGWEKGLSAKDYPANA
ncbi:hypothetical protein LJB82_00760 [Desulfovibrio sp. OttesenSCG-928-M16]|nr:hypothetical protein [Desulfovibrio sp. OttesenSCG-928-M16]